MTNGKEVLLLVDAAQGFALRCGKAPLWAVVKLKDEAVLAAYLGTALGVAPRYVFAHQVLVQCLHCHPASLRISSMRDDAPALGDRVDPAFLVGGGAQRRAVVEVGAPVPVAVPRRRLQGLAPAACGV